jgi:hypothetical protein
VAAVLVAAVPVVHEQVHQRAEQDEQVGKSPEEMRLVLGEEEEAEHDGERHPKPREHASRRPHIADVAGSVQDLILVAWPRAGRPGMSMTRRWAGAGGQAAR